MTFFEVQNGVLEPWFTKASLLKGLSQSLVSKRPKSHPKEVKNGSKMTILKFWTMVPKGGSFKGATTKPSPKRPQIWVQNGVLRGQNPKKGVWGPQNGVGDPKGGVWRVPKGGLEGQKWGLGPKNGVWGPKRSQMAKMRSKLVKTDQKSQNSAKKGGNKGFLGDRVFSEFCEEDAFSWNFYAKHENFEEKV